MSAPNEGRQSPPPEEQSGAQLNETPASGHADAVPEGEDRDNYAKDTSETQKEDVLSSNPVHPLQKAADDKVSKTQ